MYRVQGWPSVDFVEGQDFNAYQQQHICRSSERPGLSLRPQTHLYCSGYLRETHTEGTICNRACKEKLKIKISMVFHAQNVTFPHIFHVFISSLISSSVLYIDRRLYIQSVTWISPWLQSNNHLSLQRFFTELPFKYLSPSHNNEFSEFSKY